jgi:ankyrin repeat domain-containing protein 50
VNYLERSFEGENVAIAYVYFSYKELEDQTDVNLIASLLQQLVQRKPFISDDVSSLYYHHIEKRTRPTLGEWCKLLNSEVNQLSKVFIVIDALDECSESNGTRDSFLAEVRKLQPAVHLFITSRHTGSIEHEFEKAAHLEIRANDADVRKYLEHRTANEPQLVRHIKKDPALRETIINSLVEKAKGMYVTTIP